MSAINAQKLAALGYDKMRQACFVHAVKAVTYKRKGNERMFEAHTALLDQCGKVGRALKVAGKGPKELAL